MIADGFKYFLPLLAFGSFLLAGDSHATCKDEVSLYQRAQELYQAKQYLLSSVHFSQLSVAQCDPDLAQRSLFAYALSLNELGEQAEAIRNLRLSKTPRANLLLSLIPSETEMASKNLDESQRLRLAIWNTRTNTTEALVLTQSPKLRNLLVALSESPTKSPWIAGGLSTIIPGAGQAYSNSFQSAGIAFLLNALFLSSTIEFFKKDMPAAGLASGLVFSVTYIGNILNATESAQRTTQAYRAPHEEQLRNTLFPELQP